MKNPFSKPKPKIGDIQIDANGSEWVLVGVAYLGSLLVKRNSLAHRVHAEYSTAVAKSLTIEDTSSKNIQ